MRYTPANAPRHIRRKWAKKAWSPAARRLRKCHRDLKGERISSAIGMSVTSALQAADLKRSEETLEALKTSSHPARVDLPNPGEKFTVIDTDSNERYTENQKSEAYKRAAEIMARGHHYKIESHEIGSRWFSTGGPRERRNPELLVVTSNPRERSGTMRRRRRRNGKITAMIGGKRRSWRGLVRKWGFKGASKRWRKAKKYHGGVAVCSGGRRRRKKSRGRRRSTWMKLVKRWGIKGAKKRYRKGRKRRK